MSVTNSAIPFEIDPLQFEFLWDEIAAALTARGYIVLERALPIAITQGLMAHLAAEEAQLKRAGVGRKQDHQLNDAIRGDKTQWIQPTTAASCDFLAWMDALRIGLNRRLFLGLHDYESHYAIYEPGAFYHQHLDAFRGQSGRKLSTVFYLNEDWDENNGGELVLYDGANGQLLERIAPLCGRLVIFLSEDFPHEVLVTRTKRKSIAGWFRIKSV